MVEEAKEKQMTPEQLERERTIRTIDKIAYNLYAISMVVYLIVYYGVDQTLGFLVFVGALLIFATCEIIVAVLKSKTKRGL